MYMLRIKIPNAPGDGLMAVRVTAKEVIHEPNGDAAGIDEWMGVPVKTIGDVDAATLFKSRTSPGPCPVSNPAGQWYSPALAAAWVTKAS